jgi:hypothetical protein
MSQEEMLRQALGLCETALGNKRPSTLRSMNILATVLSDQGKYEQAEVMHRQALRLKETVLGKEHPDTGEHEQPGRTIEVELQLRSKSSAYPKIYRMERDCMVLVILVDKFCPVALNHQDSESNLVASASPKASLRLSRANF